MPTRRRERHLARLIWTGTALASLAILGAAHLIIGG